MGRGQGSVQGKGPTAYTPSVSEQIRFASLIFDSYEHSTKTTTAPFLCFLLFNDFKTAVILHPPLKNKLHENQNLGNNVGGQLCLILPSDLPKSRITDVASASPCFARKPRS